MDRRRVRRGGRARIGGRAEIEPPDAEVELGHGFVADPQVAWASLATLSAAGRIDRVGVAGSTWTGDGVWQVAGEVSVRMLGGRRGRDGTRLDVVARTSERRLDPSVAVATYELGGIARYDLRRLGRSLAGRYVSRELASLLLGRFAWGVYLGDGAGRGRRRVGTGLGLRRRFEVLP